MKYLLIIANCLSLYGAASFLAAQDLEEPSRIHKSARPEVDTTVDYFEAENLDKDHIYVQETSKNISGNKLSPTLIKQLSQRLVLAKIKMTTGSSDQRINAKKEYLIISKFLRHNGKQSIAYVDDSPSLEVIVEQPELSLDLTEMSSENPSQSEKTTISKKDEEEFFLKKPELEKKTPIKEEVETKKVTAKEEPKKKVEEPVKVEKPTEVIAIEKPKPLTTTFAASKGSLPWPVNNKRIVGTFGIRPNASAVGLPSENYGVDLLVNPGSTVKVIHDGKVLFVTTQQPYETIVAVDHGDYTSVYYFLTQVNVSRGSQVRAGQSIGKVVNRDQSPNFHFEIWKGQEQINPLPWMSK